MHLCKIVTMPFRCCLVLTAMLTVISAAHADGTLQWLLPGTYRLTQDEAYDAVIIGPLSTIETHNHTLTINVGGSLNCAGTLSVSDSGTLVIQGGDYASIAGVIRLKGADSLLKVAASTNLGDLQLAGKVKGEHPDATIDIAAGAMLTGRLDIEGAMTISGPGTLRNEDAVVANVEGQTLLLASDLNLSDVDNALWRAYKGTLRFTHAQIGNTRLAGDVHLDGADQRGGMLDFDASVAFDNQASCGLGPGSVFKWVEGTLSIASGCTFTYRCYSISAATECPNPDMDMCSSPEADPPFEVCGPYESYCP